MNRVCKYTLVGLLLTCSSLLYAFEPTGVAPAFFGPNALPVILRQCDHRQRCICRQKQPVLAVLSLYREQKCIIFRLGYLVDAPAGKLLI